jgi:hypothetical protein
VGPALGGGLCLVVGFDGGDFGTMLLRSLAAAVAGDRVMRVTPIGGEVHLGGGVVSVRERLRVSRESDGLGEMRYVARRAA